MSKSIHSYLQLLKEKIPDDFIIVSKIVNPARFDVTAILQHLENSGKYPALLFEKPLSVKGEVSNFKLATNIYATRQRCALALDMEPADWKFGLSLEYARRENSLIDPIIIDSTEAPVKEIVKTGADVDLSDLPIVRHHDMDGGPYIDMVCAMRDPDRGFYNASFHRNEYKNPKRLGIHMSPRHNWTIYQKYNSKNLPTPVVIIISHHPAFYLGALNVASFGVDDYHLIGGIMSEPLRLTNSQTWGDRFLVPADADIIIEGEILPQVREVEGPFGEFPGTYGPQRLRPVIDVKAITHKENAIYQDIFVGHRDTCILGGIPKEGSVYSAIKGVVPSVRAVHFAVSGCCRFNCYISVDKKVEGETKQAALMALAHCDFVKNVIVVDADIDPFNEQEVMWAVATRVQPDADIDIIRNIKANTLDPSLVHDIKGSKMIIDATMPIDRPFADRVSVPEEALTRIIADDFIPQDAFDKIPRHDDTMRSR